MKKEKLKKFFNRDIKEFNGILLSFLCIGFLVAFGVVSYKINSSYAIFTDTIEGEKTLEFTVSNNLDKSGANKPVLSENMIPVYYDETCNNNAGCWEKADITNINKDYKWYDYDRKMWANSVTVSSTNREAYLDANSGTEIPMDDILTMQVWIPRYKYTIWNYNSDGEQTSEPQEIEISFESGATTTGEIECADLEKMGTSDGTASGTQTVTSETCTIKSTKKECTDEACNGKTYTHPAFTFGEDELTGFWVGKFEVSSDTNCSSAPYSPIGEGCNIDTIRPLVKPDVISWQGAMVSVFENSIMAMNDSGNKYGFAETDDTHMMKNMEWGAAAYLSHSKYGKNSEVFINNSTDSYTGRSGGNVRGSTNINDVYPEESSGGNNSGVPIPPSQFPNADGNFLSYPFGYYTYDGYLLEKNTNTKTKIRDLSKVASTTGNIYGIYDMSGGVEEFVMGNMVSPDGEQMMSGYSDHKDYPNEHSGYSGILYYNSETEVSYGLYTGTYEYPGNKYYDKYSFNTSYSTRGRSKLGDAIKEVYDTSSHGWYSAYSHLAYSGHPWFCRGGGYSIGSVFSLNSDYGDTGTFGANILFNSARLVISQ